MSILQGANFELTHTTAQHRVGTVARNDEGQEAIYVQADDAVAAKAPVYTDAAIGGSGTAANAPYVVTPITAVDQAIVGIALVAIAAGSYGWVVTKGVVTAVKSTAAAINDFCVSSATADTIKTIPSTAVNPVKVDFDALVAACAGVRIKAVTAAAAGVSTVLLY